MTNKAPAFTLVELLVVMTVVVVLIGLVVGVAGFAQTQAARTRAAGELRALGTALERYRADQGAYPRSARTDALDARTQRDARTGGVYAAASRDLYAILTDQWTTGEDGALVPALRPAYPPPALRTTSAATSPASSGGKNYWGDLKPSLLGGRGNDGTFAANGVTAILDPWGASCGYSTAAWADLEGYPAGAAPRNPPGRGYNPTYDLWSTGGKDGGEVSVWLTNW